MSRRPRHAKQETLPPSSSRYQNTKLGAAAAADFSSNDDDDDDVLDAARPPFSSSRTGKGLSALPSSALAVGSLSLAVALPSRRPPPPTAAAARHPSMSEDDDDDSSVEYLGTNIYQPTAVLTGKTPQKSPRQRKRRVVKKERLLGRMNSLSSAASAASSMLTTTTATSDSDRDDLGIKDAENLPPRVANSSSKQRQHQTKSIHQSYGSDGSDDDSSSLVAKPVPKRFRKTATATRSSSLSISPQRRSTTTSTPPSSLLRQKLQSRHPKQKRVACTTTSTGAAARTNLPSTGRGAAAAKLQVETKLDRSSSSDDDDESMQLDCDNHDTKPTSTSKHSSWQSRRKRRRRCSLLLLEANDGDDDSLSSPPVAAAAANKKAVGEDELLMDTDEEESDDLLPEEQHLTSRKRYKQQQQQQLRRGGTTALTSPKAKQQQQPPPKQFTFDLVDGGSGDDDGSGEEEQEVDDESSKDGPSKMRRPAPPADSSSSSDDDNDTKPGRKQRHRHLFLSEANDDDDDTLSSHPPQKPRLKKHQLQRRAKPPPPAAAKEHGVRDDELLIDTEDDEDDDYLQEDHLTSRKRLKQKQQLRGGGTTALTSQKTKQQQPPPPKQFSFDLEDGSADDGDGDNSGDDDSGDDGSPGGELDEDDEESSDDGWDCYMRNQKKTPSSKQQPKPFDLSSSSDAAAEVKPLPLPKDDHEEEEILSSKVDNDTDRNLQRLLWFIGCRYQLMPYQFAGVRGVAGVAPDYPQLDNRDEEDDDDSMCSMSSSDDDGDPQKKKSDQDGRKWKRVLRETQFKKGNRGLLLADDMGLGKTVQGVVGCILRNAIAAAKRQPKLPTVLISPNSAVSIQWAETLIKAGVPAGRIFQFLPKHPHHQYRGAVYILMTRYDVQTETKYMLNLAKPAAGRRRRGASAATPVSPLFPNAPNSLLVKLFNQYESQQRARVQNRYRMPKEGAAECLSRLLSESSKTVQASAFRTVLLDEAHFLKNLLSFAGIGAGLLGLHAQRVIPMSGTPYNNGPQDMATLMTFIDPSGEAAYERWWKQATSSGAAAAVLKNVSKCLSACMLRRSKKILQDKLPTKTVVMKDVAPLPLELHDYECYEQSFLLTLEKFSLLSDSRSRSPEAMKAKKELFQKMMALSACMRMALIHPALPGGGRDWTINFSPTRCKLSAQLSDEHRCVCCKAVNKEKRDEKRKQKQKSDQKAADALDSLGDEQLEGVDDDVYLDVEHGSSDRRLFGTKKGKIVEIPTEFCWLPNIQNGGLRHYAHESCLETMKEEGFSCPSCADIRNRTLLESGKNALLKMKKEAESREVKPEKGGGDVNLLEVDRPVYCAGVQGLEGFKASAKIESIISDFKRNTPAEDKVIMLSFFKGSLDLLEGILFYDLGIPCARFDGDLPPGERQKELVRFKSDPSCRVLLMTIQTGGTGLNIVEANRCEFVDRWFNPFVHEQAEDRCYRYGQQKPVTVTYHDTSYSVDVAMRYINEIKTTNASIVLADGSSLTVATSGMTYKEMTGQLGNSVRTVREARIQRILTTSPKKWSCLMEPTGTSIFDQLADGNTTAARTPRGSKSQFNTICDAMAHLLGYIRKDTPQRPASNSKVARATPENQLTGGTSSGDSTLERSDSPSVDSLLDAPPIFSPRKRTKPAAAAASRL